ncbi:MAG TPA: 50S ribosomal protein L23 [Candidatus Hydrogenedentes bacterium]|nr:50S ribosomal protein L23 [Candidatus Hydrogenedentota bacterium]
MSVEPHKIILRPIITEESQIQTRKANQYTFRVRSEANKQQIREAIETQFPEVRVVSINTMNYQGKLRRHMGSRHVGRRSQWKKAVVTLRRGDVIDLI